MSDQPKWTPGPWKVFYTTDGQKIIGIGDAEGGGVTDPHFGLWRSGEEQKANARLIAAAPDMAEALRLFVAYDEAADDDGVQVMLNYAEALAAAKAALAKARGEAK